MCVSICPKVRCEVSTLKVNKIIFVLSGSFGVYVFVAFEAYLWGLIDLC